MDAIDINKAGTSVLLIEQNANMALSIADYGYIMETGKVVMDGDPDKLLGDEDVQEFYLGLHGEGGERKSFREVGEELGVTAEAARRLVSRAVTGLRDDAERILAGEAIPVETFLEGHQTHTGLRIAGKNGRCLIKLDVASGLTASFFIIVHCRQVVVDQ